MNKKRILLIDDEEDILLLTKLNLEGTGRYEVVTASSGEEGLERAQAEQFDLVITDYMMPQMDGIVVLKALKRMNPAPPVVLFSIYYDDERSITEDVRGIADGLVSKPIDKDHLIRIIEEALRGKSDTDGVVESSS